MNKFENNYLPYFPIVGLALYVLVFAFAAADYPGGVILIIPMLLVIVFLTTFCAIVMHPITPGGITNHARLLAIISHLILSLTMISFFYVLPKIFPIKNRNTKLIAFFGVSTMTVFIFMYTDYHDEIVTITGILGTICTNSLLH